MKKLLSLVAVLSLCALITAGTFDAQVVTNKQLPTEQKMGDAQVVTNKQLPTAQKMGAVVCDNTYNKVRILTKLAKLNWFIERRAKLDAQNANDSAFLSELNLIASDIAKHTAKLESTTCK